MWPTPPLLAAHCSGPAQKDMLGEGAPAGTSASEDSSRHGRCSLTKRCLGERPGLWHLAGPAGAGIGPRVPSGTAAPGRAANQVGRLARRDMEGAAAALNAGSARLQGCCPAAQLRTEFGAQPPGAPALVVTELLPLGSDSLSCDGAETQGHQMIPLQEMSLSLSRRPRGAGYSTAGEPTLPTAQALTANSRLLAPGPHLLGPAQERSKRGALWSGSTGLEERRREGLKAGKWELLGRARPSTLPIASPKTGKKPTQYRSGGPPLHKFLPLTQDTVALTWPKGCRRQGKGRERDLAMRFHQGASAGKCANSDSVLGTESLCSQPPTRRETGTVEANCYTHGKRLPRRASVTVRNRPREWSLATV